MKYHLQIHMNHREKNYMRIFRTICVGIMIILSIIILILGFTTISEISPLSSDYMLAQTAREITLENNPFSKVSGLSLGWVLWLLLYSYIPTSLLAFDKQARKRWLSLFWTPGIFVLLGISLLIYNKYGSLYDNIMLSFKNAHLTVYGYIDIHEEVDPAPYIIELLPLIKAAVPSLVAVCVLTCIYMFIVIFTGLMSIATPQKSVSNSKKHYSHCIMPISGQIEDRQPSSNQNEYIFCTQCGKKLESDAKFCSGCGAKIEK